MSEAPAGLDLTNGYLKVVGGAPGEGPVMRNARAVDELTGRPITAKDMNNIYDLFAMSGLKMRPNAPCFGSRIREDGSVGPYSWQTYSEVAARIDAFAAGMWKLELVPKTADGFRFIGLYCKNSRDWMIASCA